MAVSASIRKRAPISAGYWNGWAPSRIVSCAVMTARLRDQGRLLTEIAAVLRNFGKADWDNHSQVRDAFVYVLSGGDYGVLKPVADDETRYEADRTLAQGVIQSMRRGRRTRRENFGPTSIRGPSTSAWSGPSHWRERLFTSATTTQKPSHSSMKHVSPALILPSRKRPFGAKIRLVGKGDTPRAMLLLTDYLRRFGKSIYAWKLFRDFSVAAAKRDEFDSRDMIDKLTAATSTADRQSRIDLLLAMAAEGLPSGRIILARAAASEALSLKPDKPEDLTRATLYEAAANTPTTRAAEALSRLASNHGGSPFRATTSKFTRSRDTSRKPSRWINLR